MGVSVVVLALRWLPDANADRSGNVTGATQALQLVRVLGDEQIHGRNGVGEAGRALAFLEQQPVVARKVLRELLGRVVAGTGQAKPAVGKLSDAPQTDLAAPAPDPDW